MYIRKGTGPWRKLFKNIADDSIDVEMLRIATGIPNEYLEYLEGYGIRPTKEDYWDYLCGEYATRAHDPLMFKGTIPDPLIFVQELLKREHSRQYDFHVFELYTLTSVKAGHDQNGPLSQRQAALKMMEQGSFYGWQTDEKRLEKELMKLGSRRFADIVMGKLPSMPANNLTRQYMLFLYRLGETEYLIKVLKSNANLLGAYLAVDRIGITGVSDNAPPVHYEIRDCLVDTMPDITASIRKELIAYMPEEVRHWTRYRWWIRNLASISRKEAEQVFESLYSKFSVEPYEKDAKGAKRYILWGAAEGKLTNLCGEVCSHLHITAPLRRDYFSIGQSRIQYLAAACPVHMKKIVSEFDAKFLRQASRTGGRRKFETVDFHAVEVYRDSIWQGVTEYFPEKQAIKALEDYYCGFDAIMVGAFKGPITFSSKYLINCLCDKFMDMFVNTNEHPYPKVEEYLYRCYPERKKTLQNARSHFWNTPIEQRTLEGLSNILFGKKGYASPKTLFSEYFRAFFLGSKELSEEMKTSIRWGNGITTSEAFPLLDKVMMDDRRVLKQAALYAYSFYPDDISEGVGSLLRTYASSEDYPENLYAGYSLNKSRIDSASHVRAVCSKSSAYSMQKISDRKLERYTEDFAFNAIMALKLCSKSGMKDEYFSLLRMLFVPENLGRYKSFALDLEEVISNNDFDHSGLIKELRSSGRPIDIITGLRLAEIKNVDINLVVMESLLTHDDTYVRIAAAKLILSMKEKYADIFAGLKSNSNRRVRALYEQN